MTGDRVEAADVSALARMHRAALPGSMVSMLGDGYARAFYGHVAGSATEPVWLSRGVDGALTGACVVSLAPRTLARRLARATPLIRSLVGAAPRLPLLAIVRGALTRSPSPQGPGPEILLIFAETTERGRGIGRGLLARAESALRAAGETTLWVKTRDEASNRAIAFYQRAGFSSVATVASLGKRLRVFAKPLAPEPR